MESSQHFATNSEAHSVKGDKEGGGIDNHILNRSLVGWPHQRSVS